jgi:hypothetical protein
LTVKVTDGEVEPFTSIDVEVPSSGTVTTAFGTIDFKSMHTGVKGDGEIENSGFSTGPDILLIDLHGFSIHHGETTMSEVIRKLEGIFHTVLSNVECHLVVKTDVLASLSTTKSSVAHVIHVGDAVLLTESFGRWLGHGSLESSQVIHSILVEEGGLNEDMGRGMLLVGAILALGFTITVSRVSDTIAIGACILSVGITAADLSVVKLVLIETALSFSFI